MKRLALAAAVVLPLVATAAALLSARTNRAAGRDAIVLTEHELQLRPRSSDNSAAILEIRWREPRQLAKWMTRAKLEELGFNCEVDPAAPGADRHYRQALPRDAFVALEYDGPAFAAWLEAQRLLADPATKDTRRRPGRPESTSHLAAIDAAPDAATLDRRYPDTQRHLITSAIVRPDLEWPPGKPPALGGRIMILVPGEIHVPSRLIPQLASGRYAVTVRYGRRWEPWVVDIAARQP